VELTDTLGDDFDATKLLTLLATRCQQVFDVDAAGIMLLAPNGDLQVIASSSEVMHLLELSELEYAEGPCVDCFHTGRPVVSSDLASPKDTWPRFAAEALDAGFHSAHALPMRVHTSVIGALNLFRSAPGTIDAVEVAVAQAFADVVSISILQYQAASEAQNLNKHLNRELVSQIEIEQATGMLAERGQLQMARALEILRTHARNHNLRLAGVAGNVVRGTLPILALDDWPITTPTDET
jgi:GAF domain-containing protein